MSLRALQRWRPRGKFGPRSGEITTRGRRDYERGQDSKSTASLFRSPDRAGNVRQHLRAEYTQSTVQPGRRLAAGGKWSGRLRRGSGLAAGGGGTGVRGGSDGNSC